MKGFCTLTNFFPIVDIMFRCRGQSSKSFPKKRFFATARGGKCPLSFGQNFSSSRHKWICVQVWLRSVQWLGVEKRRRMKEREKTRRWNISASASVCRGLPTWWNISASASVCRGLPTWLVAWLSGRTSVFGRRTFSVLRSTCSWQVTTYVGKPSAMGQPTRPTQPFIPSGSIDESSKLQLDVSYLS